MWTHIRLCPVNSISEKFLITAVPKQANLWFYLFSCHHWAVFYHDATNLRQMLNCLKFCACSLTPSVVCALRPEALANYYCSWFGNITCTQNESCLSKIQFLSLDVHQLFCQNSSKNSLLQQTQKWLVQYCPPNKPSMFCVICNTLSNKVRTYFYLQAVG